MVKLRWAVTIGLTLGVLGTVSGCDQAVAKFEEYDLKRRSEQRVDVILKGIQEGGTGTSTVVQTSMCRWWNNTIFLSGNEADAASNRFDRWREKGRIYRKIAGYEVTGSEIDAEAEHPTVLVHGTIEGESFTMRVPEDLTISWVDTPGRPLNPWE